MCAQNSNLSPTEISFDQNQLILNNQEVINTALLNAEQFYFFSQEVVRGFDDASLFNRCLYWQSAKIRIQDLYVEMAYAEKATQNMLNIVKEMSTCDELSVYLLDMKQYFHKNRNLLDGLLQGSWDHECSTDFKHWKEPFKKEFEYNILEIRNVNTRFSVEIGNCIVD